ncbi:MAG TPA: DUF2510 domain-containing protein [Acidimicrobiales bacterium]|jgi:hypothetical protein
MPPGDAVCSESEDVMEDGSGWFADPEVEDQERYFDGSEWTTETRPADLDGPLPHLPDHVPELQRAFAAATADIEEVEARLGRLFDRAQEAEPGGSKAAKAPAPKAEPDPAAASIEADAKSQPGSGPSEHAQPAGVEALLGTKADDDDAFAELDEALATEEPEKLKRGPFRRRS